MKEVGATCACVVFCVEALYISVVQHPASLETGAVFAGRVFPPMYRRTSAIWLSAAIGGAPAGIVAWCLGAGAEWLAGALLLIAVIAFTVVWIMPVDHEHLAKTVIPRRPILRLFLGAGLRCTAFALP